MTTGSDMTTGSTTATPRAYRPAHEAARPGATAYLGTGPLLRLAWRRDRVLIPICVAALAALSVGSAQATLALYPTPEAAQEGLGSILANPAVSAMYGPIVTNRDGMAVFKTVMMGALFVGILAHALVRRHTRTEEEEGRLELVGAGVVGRRAPLTAAVLIALAATTAAALISTIGLAALGLDLVGSVAFGLSWFIAGAVMTGVAAVAAQLTTTSRAAGAVGLSTLAVMFVLRAIGDTQPDVQFLSWLSPFGWVGEVRPYGDNRLWLLIPTLGLLAVCLAAAVMLLERRDLGAGLLPDRPGPSQGRGLRSPLALAWRTDRGTTLGWAVGYAVLAVVVGSLAASVGEMMQEPQVADMLAKMGGSVGTITDIYLATELRFAAAGAAAAGIMLANRLAVEERLGRADQVLATAAGRAKVYAARVLLAWGLPVVLLTLLGLLVATSAAQAGVTDVTVPNMLGAALAALPATWLIIAIALAAYGIGHRFTAPVGWAALAVALVLGEFGPLLDLPSWLVALSPLDHLSPLPGGVLEVLPTVVMTVLAALLTGFGLMALRRRDVG